MEVNGLIEEVEALKSIYFRELEVTNDEITNVPTRISINLHPATAENTQEQYVCLTLVIGLPKNYPNELPEIVIRNPRGLSDEDFERIKTDLLAKATESQGNAMLYELIEIAKEHLTMGNTPRCACAICLYGFTDADMFTKTGCYHYFHSHCLARYVKCVMETPVSSNPLAVEAPDEDVKVLCPVCREPIEYDPETLQAPPPLQSEGAAPFELDSELVKLQQKMSELFDKQKSQGGIIDVEAEKNKYLLEISSVPTELDNGLSEALVRTEAKSTNQKPGKKEPQRYTRKPTAQEREEQQQDRKPFRDNRRNQPLDRSVTAAIDWQTDRQNHNRGRGGGYRTNRWPDDGAGGRYPNRNNRGRGPPEQRDLQAPRQLQNDRQYLHSNPRNSSEMQHNHKQANGAHFRSPEGPFNHADNGYRRPNFGQRGRGEGRRREEHHQPRGRSAEDGDATELAENGSVAPIPQGSGARKMDWAEQVGEEESPPPRLRTDLAPHRRGFSRAPRGQRRVENPVLEDGAVTLESDDSYRKRNNNYRNYRRWNQASTPEKAAALSSSSDAAPSEAKAGGREACPNKACGDGSESIPVSRFMVLTGPPTMAFADSAVNSLSDAAGRCRRPPPGFLQAQSTANAANPVKTFAAMLPPGFKTRPESTTITMAAAPPGFEEK